MHLRNAAIGLVQREVQATVAQVRRRAQAASRHWWLRRPPATGGSGGLPPLVAQAASRHWWRLVRSTRATAAQVHDWPDLSPEPDPDHGRSPGARVHQQLRPGARQGTPTWSEPSVPAAAEWASRGSGHPRARARRGLWRRGLCAPGQHVRRSGSAVEPSEAGSALEPLRGSGAPARRRPAHRLHCASVPPPCRRCSSPPTSRRSSRRS
jgi:hypothetical protein